MSVLVSLSYSGDMGSLCIESYALYIAVDGCSVNFIVFNVALFRAAVLSY